LIDLFFERAGIVLPAGLTCLELRCGVGRTTRFLTQKFAKVYAADFSDHHIRVAKDYLNESCVENVDLVWLKEMDDLRELPQFDFFFSFIVPQHNPPPVQLAILEIVLAKIRKGGGCLF
jgi:2-polyprenyl-3-methyl-5-hydroxy-6-metoxy-1,4-benzoquinol methylase